MANSPLIVDGNAVAKKVREETIAMVNEAKALGSEPSLAVVLVGLDPASATYVSMKEHDAESCGIKAIDCQLHEDASQELLNRAVMGFNADPNIDGILVQMPIPKHLDPEEVIPLVSVSKDVDGFHPANLGNLLRGNRALRPCTPEGVMRLLEEGNVDIAGKHAVVVGRSTLVGKPMSFMLLEADAIVTMAHSKTRDLKEVCREADILIAATGNAKLIKGDFIKEGAVVIDVGINRTEEGLVGDVDFDDVAPRCSVISPVPGGVGPMTRAMLMKNTAIVALEHAKAKAKARTLISSI